MKIILLGFIGWVVFPVLLVGQQKGKESIGGNRLVATFNVDGMLIRSGIL